MLNIWTRGQNYEQRQNHDRNIYDPIRSILVSISDIKRVRHPLVINHAMARYCNHCNRARHLLLVETWSLI